MTETQLICVHCLSLHACVYVSPPTDSHEAVFSLALLQRVFNDAAQFEEEQLLRRLGCGAWAFGLTILFTQRLGTGVAYDREVNDNTGEIHAARQGKQERNETLRFVTRCVQKYCSNTQETNTRETPVSRPVCEQFTTLQLHAATPILIYSFNVSLNAAALSSLDACCSILGCRIQVYLNNTCIHNNMLCMM